MSFLKFCLAFLGIGGVKLRPSKRRKFIVFTMFLLIIVVLLYIVVDVPEPWRLALAIAAFISSIVVLLAESRKSLGYGTDRRHKHGKGAS